MYNFFVNKKKNNKGFTLVELVIVVAILAILVGLLAPQYTKYVEKSRKAADASNMDELVNVVKIYAADPNNDLKVGSYTITITDGKGTVKTDITSSISGDTTNIGNLKSAVEASIPKWNSLVTKSKKWNNGVSSPISAIVTVNDAGGTKVQYCTGTKYNDTQNYFETYMIKGSEQ